MNFSKTSEYGKLKSSDLFFLWNLKPPLYVEKEWTASVQNLKDHKSLISFLRTLTFHVNYYKVNNTEEEMISIYEILIWKHFKERARNLENRWFYEALVKFRFRDLGLCFQSFGCRVWKIFHHLFDLVPIPTLRRKSRNSGGRAFVSQSVSEVAQPWHQNG